MAVLSRGPIMPPESDSVSRFFVLQPYVRAVLQPSVRADRFSDAHTAMVSVQGWRCRIDRRVRRGDHDNEP